MENDAKVKVTPNLLEQIAEINKALDRCSELALKKPLPNKQITLMTDASFSAAGYAVFIEDHPMEKYSSTRKVFAQVAFGSKTFSPDQLKMSIYAKRILSDIPCLQGIWTHLLGDPDTEDHSNRQQVGHSLFSNQNHSTNPV